MKAAVIGAGPAGYAAALRLRKHGIEVDVFEKNRPGGVCLNRGCVPTKYLLAYARAYYRAKEMGFEVSGATISDAVEYARKGAEQFSQAVQKLLAQAGVRLIQEQVEVLPERTVRTASGEKTYDAVLIASGSEPVVPQNLRCDGVLTGEDFSSLPADINTAAVIGGGVQGIEYASFFNMLGAEAHIFELTDHVLPVLPEKYAKLYESRLKRRGIKIHTGTMVESIRRANGKFEVIAEDPVTADVVVIVTGRRPVTDFVQVKHIIDDRGFIRVNEHFETDEPGVYAAGDVIDTPALAYTAYAEGEAAADSIAGVKTTVDYSRLPYTVFGEPEIGWTGELSGEEVRVQAGLSAKARAARADDGFVCLFSRDGVLKGGLIVGEEASETVHIISALLGRKNFFDLHFIHPSLSELIGEALLTIQGKSRHGR